MIGETISHYRIEEQLGQGGMGIVYRAVDTKLKRDVALKFRPPQLSADPDAKARFMQEAQAASSLDHPNICTIHEIGEVPYRASSEIRGASAEEIGEADDGRRSNSYGSLPNLYVSRRRTLLFSTREDSRAEGPSRKGHPFLHPIHQNLGASRPRITTGCRRRT